jgi:hypothetical protein
MIKMKCDNDDGSINWESRASIIVISGLLAGLKRTEILEQIKDNEILTKLVKENFKRIDARKEKIIGDMVHK